MINSIVNTGFPPAVNVQNKAAETGTVQAAPVSSSGSGSSGQTTGADSAQIKEAVSKLNDYVQKIQRNLSFSVDKDTGRTVIKIYDSQTKQVIKQLPPEQTLELAASIDQQLAHLSVREQA